MNKHVVHGHVLSEDLEKRLQRVAARSKSSATELLEAALNYFLDQVETDEEIEADMEDRLREMKETGLHLTNDEVMEWLERVANGEDDLPLPKAHT